MIEIFSDTDLHRSQTLSRYSALALSLAIVSSLASHNCLMLQHSFNMSDSKSSLSSCSAYWAKAVSSMLMLLMLSMVSDMVITGHLSTWTMSAKNFIIGFKIFYSLKANGKISALKATLIIIIITFPHI